MIAAPVSDAEAARRTAAYYRARVDRARQKHENRVRGLDVLMQLDDGHKVEFRGRHYGVPPVPWPLVIKTLAAQARVAELMGDPEATLADWGTLCRSVSRLFVRVANTKDIPLFRRILGRFFWRLSPLAGATISEVVQVLSFFCVFLKLDGGLLQSPKTTQGPPPPSTSPSTSPRTRKPSPTGATVREGHVVGSIS